MESAKLRLRRILSLLTAISCLVITSHASPLQDQPSGIHWATRSLDSVLAMAKSHNKKVMVFVFSPSCGFCSAMDRDVLSSPEISDYINRSYVPVKFENASTEGLNISDRYHIPSLPTFLFLKGDASEFDRIVGLVAKDTFMVRINKIFNDTSALDEYREQLKSNPTDAQLLQKVFSVYTQRGDVRNAETQMQLIKEADPASFRSKKESILSSYSRICYDRKYYDRAIAATDEIINDILDQRLKSRYTFVANCYVNMQQNQKAMEVYYKLLDIAPQDIHSYTNIVNHAYLTKINIDKAIETGKKGLSVPADSATKAELVYSMARLYQKKQLAKKALEMMNSAFAFRPTQAYQDLKEQFAGGSRTKSILLLSQDRWNFGSIRRGERIETIVSVENNGKSALDVQVIKTCNCLEAEPDVLKLNAGLKATIKFSYQPIDDTGKVEKLFILETNAKGKERVLFPLSGEVR
jgi:thioredoxin-related protein